jgi:hypothetical protein
MHHRDSATLITLNSSGSVTTQRFVGDELLVEGYLDGGMFSAHRHPLLAMNDGEGSGSYPQAVRPRRGSRKRK